ncbi:ArsR/SmtB family transcription factor [Roseibium sp.]|uniref:ArsR/SmtB family transcription factor n=1 Tax=Roseibium sp. TaxID=1936156 RepID=UPI003B50522C
MSIDLQPTQTSELADTFGLLSDSTRLSIVLACLDQEQSAGDIAEKLGVSPSLVSHHLRLLRGARMLKSDRRGKQIFYAMNDTCVRDVLKIMIDHLFVHDHSHEGSSE